MAAVSVQLEPTQEPVLNSPGSALHAPDLMPRGCASAHERMDTKPPATDRRQAARNRLISKRCATGLAPYERSGGSRAVIRTLQISRVTGPTVSATIGDVNGRTRLVRARGYPRLGIASYTRRRDKRMETSAAVQRTKSSTSGLVVRWIESGHRTLLFSRVTVRTLPESTNDVNGRTVPVATPLRTGGRPRQEVRRSAPTASSTSSTWSGGAPRARSASHRRR